MINELDNKKKIIYLDKNIFSGCANLKDEFDKEFYKFLIQLSNQEEIVFVYSSTHIEETNEVNVNSELRVIKEITKDSYIDFREDINNYTIRPRCPFECYKTVNEISPENLKNIFANIPIQELEAKGIDKKALESLESFLVEWTDESKLFNLLPAGYQKEIRDQTDLNKVDLNNSKNLAEFIQKVDKSLSDYHAKMLSSDEYKYKFLECGLDLEPFTFKKLLELNPSNNIQIEKINLLSLIKTFGFANKEKIEKRKNEQSDLMHATYPCDIFISEDKGIRRLKKLIGENAVSRKEFIRYHVKFMTTSN